MKKPLSRAKVSAYRKLVLVRVEKIKQLALKAGYRDILFKGIPLEVFRKCGKERCRCISGHRHGPYKVIQVWEEKKSKQVTLKHTEEKYYELAKHYQFQMNNRKELVELLEQVKSEFDLIIEARCIWNKE